MNTYDVKVNGKTVLTEIPSDKLETELLTLRGLVWTSGGKEDDIQVILNNTTT
jgi:hypothetical protein